MREEPLENKILKSLFESPKTFGELLKAIIISRPVLAKKLKALQKTKWILKQGSRKSKYQINPLYFDRSPLYPDIVAAVLFKSFDFAYKAQFTQGAKLLREYAQAGNKEKFEKTQAALGNSIDRSYETMPVGHIILYLMTIQCEKDIHAQEVIQRFIRFLYHFIKSSVRLREAIKKTDGFKKIEFVITTPYQEQEKILNNLIEKDAAELILDKYLLEKDMNIENFTKITKILLSEKDEFYAELGFPFDLLHNKIKDNNPPISLTGGKHRRTEK